MSFNGTYRACCCGGETEPCDCSLYKDCLDYIKQNCKFGECNLYLQSLRNNHCKDPSKEDSFFCPIDSNNDGIFEENLDCEVKCTFFNSELTNTTTWSDPCNNYMGEICGLTCDQVYEGDPLKQEIGWDGDCWSGNCIDESPNGIIVVAGSQSIKYITNQNDPCPKAIHVYYEYQPSENGCCPPIGPSPGFFEGFDGLENNTDNFIFENLLFTGDKCVNCESCTFYIAESLSGLIENENCPQFTCSDITTIENNSDFIKCDICFHPFDTGEGKCPTPCTLIDPNDCSEQDSQFIVNEILECGCPCGQKRVYNCKCVDCTGGTLSNCCEVEVEGFNFDAANTVFNFDIAECPSYPVGDPCCDFPLYSLPNECACWGARYLRVGEIPDHDWILQQNKDPFRGCITPCDTIVNCLCSTYNVPKTGDPVYFSNPSGIPFENIELINCSHGSTCCPCVVELPNGNIDFDIPPEPLLESCVDNKGNPACPSGYTFRGNFNIPDNFECCQ